MTQSLFDNGKAIQDSPILNYYEIDDLDIKSDCEGGFYNGFQLGEGRFESRLVVADLGGQTVYKSYINQPIARQINNRSSDFIFVVALDYQTDAPPRKGLIYGHKIEPSQLVGIIPPNSECVHGSPPHVTNLKLRVSRNTLWAHLSAYPQLVEWFDSLTDGTTVHSPALAYRLRQDLSLVLESAAIAGNARSTQIIKRAVLVCIVQSLALEFAKRSGFETLTHSQSFTTFRLALPRIHRQLEEFYKKPASGPFHPNQLREFGSRRSIEKSFSDSVGVGPRTFSRIVQLHHFRRRLIAEAQSNPKIGNLAAEFGFWDAGRLSALYRRQFGETPSKTLKRSSWKRADRPIDLKWVTDHRKTQCNSRQLLTLKQALAH